jgi:ankyrin repeat protein
MMPSRDKLISAVYRKDYNALNKLLVANSVDACDQDGRTLLMHAALAEDSDPQMIRFLAKQGADVNAADKEQRWTALHFAARDQKREIVEALIDVGAEVDPADSFGNTPLWRCVMNRSPNVAIVKQLLAHGADAGYKNKHDVSPRDTARNMGNVALLALLGDP